MARFSEYVIGVVRYPGFREANMATHLFVEAVRWGLRDARLEAPWQKLAVSLVNPDESAGASRVPVEGVSLVYLSIDLERLRDLVPATGTQLAAALTHDALALLRTRVDWDDTAFRAIVDEVAAHRGPFVRYPASLAVDRRPGSYRIAYEMDEHGLQVLLDHRPKGEETWRRALVRDFPAAWGFPIDYEPRRLRVGSAGVELLNPRGRVLDTVPTDDLASERWTTLPSGA